MMGVGRSYQITSVFPEFSVLVNVMLAVQPHAGHSFSFWRPLASERRWSPARTTRSRRWAWRSARTCLSRRSRMASGGSSKWR